MYNPFLGDAQTAPTIGGFSAPAAPPAPVSVPTVAPAAVPPPTPVTTLNSSMTTPTSAPVPVPAPAVPKTAQNALGSSVAAFGAKVASQATDAPPTTPTTPTAAPKTTLQDALGSILGLNAKLGTKASETDRINTEAGVADKTKKVQDLTNEYNARSRYYDTLIKNAQTQNPEGKSADAISAEVDQLTREKNSELADIAIQHSAATGDLTTAQTIAKQKIDAEFEPVQAQIDNLKSYYTLASNDLTESEKMQAQAAIQEKQSQLDEAKQKRLIDYRAKITATSGNGPSGASPELLNAISAGTIDPGKVNSRTLGFYNAVAKAGVNAAASHAGISGNTAAYADVQRYQTTATRVVGVLDKNLPLLVNLADKVNQTGVPGLDQYVQGVKAYTGNDQNVIKYVNTLKTLRSEYAQMLSKGNAPTESDKAEAAQAIPAGLSGAGYQALGAQLNVEANNIISTANETKAGIFNTSAPTVVPASQVPAGYYQASDGKFYKK